MARSEEALTGKPQKQFDTFYSCQLKVYAVFSGLNRKDLAGILLFRQKINFFFFFFFFLTFVEIPWEENAWRQLNLTRQMETKCRSL